MRDREHTYHSRAGASNRAPRLLVALGPEPAVTILTADFHELAVLEPLRRGIEEVLRVLLADGVAA